MTAWLHRITLTSCYRTVKKQKWVILAFLCSMYLTLFVVIFSYQTVTRMPRRVHQLDTRGPTKLGTHPNRINDLHSKQRKDILAKIKERAEPLEIPPFQFSRDDLRLQFKAISSVPDDPRYDNTDQFHCQQSQHDRLNNNMTEDLWCQPRPKYTGRYKNPCFTVEPNPLYPYGGTTCVPYFHVLGADKCGTTDFHSRLTDHPRILLNGGGLGKETYYWCWLRYGLWMKKGVPNRMHWQRYLAYYYKPSIQIVTEVRRSGQQMITGDGTPMDLWDFRGWKREPRNAGLDEPRVLTPHVMRHMYEDPKFFVLMRNPVDRLYSDYIFLGYGFSPEKFARDVPVAVSMMRDCLQVNSTRSCFFSNDMYHRMPMRLHIGCYSIFLREWLSVFKREKFYFLRTEDYHVNMTTALAGAYKFLGVDTLTPEELKFITSPKIKHQTVIKQKVGKMFRKTRALLEEFYAPFNEDLAKLLGDDRYLWSGSGAGYGGN